MDEDIREGEARPTGADQADSWQEVGEQLRLLGRSLADALRAAWESEANRRRMQSLANALESLAKEVGEAAKGVLSTQEAEQVRISAEKLAESAREAGSQTLEEARPHLVSALRQLNSELSALIERLEQEGESAQCAERIQVEGPAPDTPVPPVQAVEGPPEEEEASHKEPPTTEQRPRIRQGRPVAEVDPDPWWWAWSGRR